MTSPGSGLFLRLAGTSSLLFLLTAPFVPILPAHGLLPAHAAAAPQAFRAEEPYSVIVGTVWGPDDYPVYGVKVKIRRVPETKPRWEVYSDHRGEFAQRFPAGKATYVVSADLKNFKTRDKKPLHLVQEVTVQIEGDERVDIGLHLTQ